ncbi:RimJ/RimL family protein N-acetyltransferase [Marmoricola sp. OAE513]|uniref:GNAT family N-acetyltransferase n=1 Tax=Marmoricola sp. OAE513 TaxID=2817894 RepID=UPI001AE40188
MASPQLQTERLVLRQWKDDDLWPFVELNADPEVMEYFPAPVTAEQSAEMMGVQQSLLDAGKPALFAAEIWATSTFIGFIGLSVPRFEAPFTPCVEIGWRLARSAWGHGYATEGADAVLKYAFVSLGLPEVVSFTAEGNKRSRAVMERLRMSHDPAEDFDHPSVPSGDPLQRHVLYRKSRPR